MQTSHSRRSIELIGSCNTLVAQRILEKHAHFSNKSFLEYLDRVEAEKVARILVGTILLDTANLDPKQKKATPK